MDLDKLADNNQSTEDEDQDQIGLIHNKGAMLSITLTVMNFLWIFPTLGAIMIFVTHPVPRGESGISTEDFLLEHWLSVIIIFLQLVFFNGWLMTRHLMPKKKVDDSTNPNPQ